MITLITAIAGLLTAITGFALLFRKVQQVHVLVNSQLHRVMELLTASQGRSSQLKDSLKDAGIPVPPETAKEKT